MSGFPDYDRFDGMGLADLVRRKEVRAEELIEEAIARIERVDPALHAIARPMYEHARAAARQPSGSGPFAGVPFLLKDLHQTIPGVETSGGSQFFRGHRPDHETTLYRRFREAGFVTVGKTNTPELGLVPTTEPRRFGPTHNPWDPRHSAGGSSGGSAAAVAARIVPIASGGDGGGSIRIPASCCGIFGLKPTRARTPAGPDVSEMWNGFAVEHVLTRSVRDSAAVLDATHGGEVGAPYAAPAVSGTFLDAVAAPRAKLRIAFYAEPPMPAVVHPDCADALSDAVALLGDLGHEVVEVRPSFARREIADAFFTVVAGNTAAELRMAEELVGRKAALGDFEVETWLTKMIGERMSADRFALALRRLQTETRRLARLFEAYDAILTPTLAKPPIELGQLHASGIEARLQEIVARRRLGLVLRLPFVVQQAVDRVFNYIPFTPVANFTGQPSMSVPLHWNRAGLPIGVMLTGRFGDEATLLGLAAQLEEARPWRDRKPPISA